MRQSGPGFVVCAGCHKSYKRLSTHITQNAACAMHYTTNDTAHNTAPLATTHNTCQNSSVTSNVPTMSRFSSSVQAVNRNFSSSRERNKMTYSPEKNNSIEDADSINDGAIPSFDDGASDIFEIYLRQIGRAPIPHHVADRWRKCHFSVETQWSIRRCGKGPSTITHHTIPCRPFSTAHTRR